jgi:hypothetical protein
MSKIHLAAVLLALLAAAPIAAMDLSGLTEPLQPDRPDFTDGPYTLERGHVQVEGGYTFERQDDEDTGSLGAFVVRIGLAERLELDLGVPARVWIDGPDGKTSGWEDAGAGVKIRLTGVDPAPGRPVVGLLLQTSVPTGSDRLTGDVWQPVAKLALDWELTDTVSLATNVGWSSAQDTGLDQRFRQIFASLSLGLGLTDRLGAFVEGYGFTKEEKVGPSTHYFDAGLSWLATKDLSFDVETGRGWNGADSDWWVGAGAAVRW